MSESLAGFFHRWVPGRSERVLLALHGTGGDEKDLLPLANTLDPDAAVLSPRGRVDEAGSNRFFRRFAEGVFDQENLREETDALAQFLREAAVKYGFAANKLLALGFSNGANMGASLLLRHPDVLAGGVLIRAMVPFTPPQMPDLMGKRVLILAGRHDPIVPAENVEALSALLARCGADAQLKVLEATHNLTRQDIEAAKGWLAAIEQ